MHVLIAPDKFKGSLSGLKVAQHVAADLLRSLPDLDVALAPVADGGDRDDGTLEALTPYGFSWSTP